MALSDIDRRLLERCLGRQSRSWEDFVDRFIGLVIHVINHTSQARSIHLTLQDREDLAAEVFLAIIDNDFAILRKFRGESSLATYLTVISRRVVVRQLMKRSTTLNTIRTDVESDVMNSHLETPDLERINDKEEVEHLMAQIGPPEAEVIRLYHLEGKSYREISALTGLPENSIGPTLSRARSKMRKANADSSF